MHTLFTALKDSISGDVTQAESQRHQYSQDFGKLLYGVPAIVVKPSNTQDLAQILKLANEFKATVNIRGTAHSCFGQSLAPDGILIVQDALEQHLEIEGDRVSVSGHLTWNTLETTLNAQGLSCPVLTDYLDMTIAGTLAVGGIGANSITYGTQADTILDLDLILPTGKTVRCSPTENPDLFHYSLAGLGQLGLITQVRFRAIPDLPHTQLFTIECPTPNDLIGILRQCEPEFGGAITSLAVDYTEASFICRLGTSFKEHDQFHNSPLKTYVQKYFPQAKEDYIPAFNQQNHQKICQWLEQMTKHGSLCQLWEDYFFDLEGFSKFLNLHLAPGGQPNIGNIYSVKYCLGIKNQPQTPFPFSPAYGHSGSFVYSIGFYHLIHPQDQRGIAKTKGQLAQYKQDCLEMGGKPYLYGWHDLSESEKEQFYKQDYQNLKQLQKKYDPQNILSKKL